jgi:Tol biopolymer transport system component/streptogramin lyase
MPDIKERFRVFDQVEPPDLWHEAERRGPLTRVVPEPRPIRRVLVAAFALVIAVVAVGFAIHAIGGSRSRPSSQISPGPIGRKTNGLIYFQGGGEGGTWTDAIEPDGTGRQTVFGREGGYYDNLAWSPDGTQIAYVGIVRYAQDSDDHQVHFGIFTANPDGSNARLLVEGLNEGWPSWSPDGTKITFSSTRADPAIKNCEPGGDLSCPTDIYVMNADGTGISRVTDDAAPEYAPAWSPDGTQIAFVRSQGGAQAIDVVNTDGTGLRQLATGTGGNQRPFTWSPDGTEIAFVRIGASSWDIDVVNADGTDVRTIFSRDGVWSEGPAWSPDGTEIAFSSTLGAYPLGCGVDSDVCSDLFVMASDGNHLTALTQGSGGVSGIAWQPLPYPSPTPVISLSVSASVIDRIDVGRGTSVAYGAGSVWVAIDPATPSGPAVLRIDPQTDKVVATITTPVASGWDIGGGGLLVAHGSVWVAGSDGSGGALVHIDPSRNGVAETIRLNGGDVADVAADDHSIWALMRGNPGQPEVVRIDSSSGQVLATIPLKTGYGRYVFSVGGSVFAAVAEPSGGPFDDGTLVRIDPSTNQVAGTLDLGTYPSVATGNGAIWATTEGGALVRIDPATDQPKGPGANVSCSGDALAVGTGGVWCFDPARGRALTRFNPSTAQVDVSMSPDQGTGGMALTTSPGSVWVISGQQLIRIDVE